MERKRTPLALETSAPAAKQHRTPPSVSKNPSRSESSFIWRTRSLDDGRCSSSKKAARDSPSGGNEERRHCDENLMIENNHHQQEEDRQQRLQQQQEPLHSSFDASLLENDDFHSIFRVSKRRASDSEGGHGLSSSNDLTPYSSGRKHLRQPNTLSDGTAHKTDLDNNGEEDELVCPGTVRKLARHNSNESIKSKGTPVRPPTHNWRATTTTTTTTTNASSNSRAQAAVAAAPQSVWKPPLIKFPLTPTAPNSTATTHPPTTQERPFETTTTEMDSMATNNSPSTTPFRFTSFPASLPRVHPPLREMNSGCSSSVRKRMFPPSSTGTTTTTTHAHQQPPSSTAGAAGPAAVNHSREEDGTQNTSISSLSTHGEEDPRMPPVHTRRFMEEYANSDDDDEDDEDDCDDDDCTGGHRGGGGTRLNFNLLLSPKMPLPKDESPFKDLGEAAQQGMYNKNCGDIQMEKSALTCLK